MVDRQNLFDQPVKNDLRIYVYDKIKKNAIVCLVDCPYFESHL